ncbi:MAG: hypothetical protein JXQ71_08080 [Verrucomicrobia bacterium]|nr:hypothetical protein [Verrucomicrobiota bacterium]
MPAVKRNSRTPSPPRRAADADAPPGPVAPLAQLWPGVVFRQRPDLTFEFVTAAIETLTGISPPDWQTAPSRFWDTVHELDAGRVEDHLRRCEGSEAAHTLPFRVRHLRHGRISHILECRRACRDRAGQLVGYEGLWLDQTRQTAAEQRLAGASWHETLAAVTMGMAHGFNNLLAGIGSLSETYLAQIGPQHAFHEGLSLIRQKAQQASQMIHRIVAIHRARPGTLGYHDLNEIVRDALDLMRQALPQHTPLTADLSPDALPLYTDDVALRQVVVTLTRLAADTTAEHGELLVTTRLWDQVPELSPTAGVRPRTPCCGLSVRAIGDALQEANLQFLSTAGSAPSSPWRQSDAALHHARQFAQAHQGLLAVDTASDGRATVHLWLPQADFTEADQAERQRHQEKRRVLLVGPPSPARDRMAGRLRQCPFHVHVIPDHAEAWLQSPDDPIHGVILQGDAGDDAHALIRFVRRHRLPVKVVLQLLASPAEPMETQFLLQADLVLPPNLPEERIAEQLRRLWDPPSLTD